MEHVFHALLAGHLQRRALGRILLEAPEQSSPEIDLEALKSDGVRALVFDFDGVLAAHGATHPLPQTQDVLAAALRLFGDGHVYILSNKPSPERLLWFEEHFPKIVFVGGVRKKPYPDGLEKISELGGYLPEQVALLDDRLLTGGLACLTFGAKFVYITKPFVDFSRHPLKETFFAVLRRLEAVLARFAA